MPRSARLAVLLVLALCLEHGAGQANVSTYTLGFMSPSADSSIPASLATAWQSAFRVALEVLNSEGRTYRLEGLSKESECDWQAAQRGAEAMVATGVEPPLIGAVGPACSGAAMACARVFREHNIPLVSFAATAEPLSARAYFPTFFRTVYSDTLQAAAVAASIAKLNMTKVTMLSTKDYYSENLAQDINATVGGSIDIRSVLLEFGVNTTIDTVQLGNVLDKVETDEFVIMAVLPLQARDIWQAAFRMRKTEFPNWYFGTDGATAFDPADENSTDPELVNTLVGEIGLSPFSGDFSANSPCSKFYSYWQKANYPGFPSEGQNKTRSYVPHLFDAVTTYFEIIDNLIKNSMEINSENVLLALNGSGPGNLNFLGCTGMVAFDQETGSRSTVAQVPTFDFVSLTPSYWEIKGQIQNGTFLNLQPLSRPGGQFSPDSTYIGPNPNGTPRKGKAGVVVGTLFGVIVVLALVGGAAIFYLHKRKRFSKSAPFVRIFH